MATNGHTQDESLLRALVDAALHRRPGPEFWKPGLDARSRDIACTTYFLLGTYDDDGRVQQTAEDGYATNTVEFFITHTLTRLVRQLSRRTERRQVTLRGHARGRILWPATFKARHTGDNDETRFVCREVHRLYDTPENQLVKHVVEQLFLCLEQVPENIRKGRCYRSRVKSQPFVATGSRLAIIESSLRLLRQNAFLRQVSPPERIDEYHLLSAETARMVEYADVARVYKAYQQAVVDSAWPRISCIGRQVMPLPQEPDPDDAWFTLGAAVLRS
jgi:hypothetical protein